MLYSHTLAMVTLAHPVFVSPTKTKGSSPASVKMDILEAHLEMPVNSNTVGAPNVSLNQKPENVVKYYTILSQ